MDFPYTFRIPYTGIVNDGPVRGRPRLPLGKRVVIPVRVSEPMRDAIDAARGEVPRSAWIEEAVAARLAGPAPPLRAPGAVRKAAARQAEVQAPRAAAGTVTFLEPGGVPVASEPVPEVPAAKRGPKNCKHPNMRLSKGVCPDCSEWVSK